MSDDQTGHGIQSVLSRGSPKQYCVGGCVEIHAAHTTPPTPSGVLLSNTLWGFYPLLPSQQSILGKLFNGFQCYIICPYTQHGDQQLAVLYLNLCLRDHRITLYKTLIQPEWIPQGIVVGGCKAATQLMVQNTYCLQIQLQGSGPTL